MEQVFTLDDDHFQESNMGESELGTGKITELTLVEDYIIETNIDDKTEQIDDKTGDTMAGEEYTKHISPNINKNSDSTNTTASCDGNDPIPTITKELKGDDIIEIGIKLVKNDNIPD